MQLNTSFKEKSSKIHNNHYDYSLVVYKDSKTKVKIICSIHGVFEQTPNNHLKGSGCPKYSHLCGCGCPSCAEEYRHDSCRATKEEFVIKAINRHGNIYDYSKIVYVNALSKVAIICKKHGIFYQTPGSHLYGQGCPHCLESHGEKIIAAILDANAVRYEREKHFYGCSCKRKLLFDFYIPSENMCIEYDGIQHFEPITHFGGKVAFEKIRTYDKIKNDFCKDKGILLIRFSYMDKKEYIQNVLCSIIKPSMRV